MLRLLTPTVKTNLCNYEGNIDIRFAVAPQILNVTESAREAICAQECIRETSMYKAQCYLCFQASPGGGGLEMAFLGRKGTVHACPMRRLQHRCTKHFSFFKQNSNLTGYCFF